MRQGRRIVAAFFAALLCLSVVIPVMPAAAEELDQTEELTREEKKERKRLKKLYKLPVQTNELTGWAKGPGTYGEAAILMEVETGAILYAKNIDAHYYPASITKILTTLVALENGQMEDKVTFSDDSLSFLEPGDAYIGMKAGNVISLEQALYAVLLASANEVSYAVSESVGKNKGYDYDWFINQMNVRCQELGGKNSHFVNANGLHDDDHYTCARDMALIARELFKYPKAFEIMQTLQYKIKKSKTTEKHIFQQNHKMLYEDNDFYYEYVIGGKTGFTDQAHNTLVTMIDNGEMKLVCVLMKSEGVNVYTDTKALCEYAFSNFKKVPVSGSETSGDIAEILPQEEGGFVVLPEGVGFEKLDREIVPDEGTAGEAELSYTYEGNYVGGARARLSADYGKEEEAEPEPEKEISGGEKKSIDARTVDENSGEDEISGVLKKIGTRKIALAAAVIVLIALIFALLEYILLMRKKKHRRR